MIAVDTNVLVYAHRPESPFHDQARAAIRGLAEAPATWAIPFHCLVEFAGVVSHPRIWKVPSSGRQIDRQVQAWLEAPGLRILSEGADMWPVLAAGLIEARIAGGAVHDARIAACCRHHGVRELWTADRDFSRYPWLRCRNPLVA